jgi:hypothetical protein
LDGSPASVVRPVAEGRIPAISLDPLQRRLTVSRFRVFRYQMLDPSRGSELNPLGRIVGMSYKWLPVSMAHLKKTADHDGQGHVQKPLANRFLSAIAVHSSALLLYALYAEFR